MKNRIKKTIHHVPSRQEMEILVADIRHLKIILLTINAEREVAVKVIDDRVAPKLDKINSDLEEKIAAVQSWAEANPAEFEKKKSLDLTHGTIGFRTGTPKLALLSRAWTWAKSLHEIQALLPAFIRSTPEIDKEALIAQRDEEIIRFALPRVGLKVVQDESFYVEPKIEEIHLKETKPAA